MRKTEDNLDYLVDYVEKEYIQGRFGRGKENHKLQDFHQELGMFIHLFQTAITGWTMQWKAFNEYKANNQVGIQNTWE